MQEIWAAGIDWDDPLPTALLNRWHNWLVELQQFPSVEIPRCIRRPFPKEKVLYMFSDASKDAYSACGYLVCHYESTSPTSILIASKSRVAPMKYLSIPRLELMGAVISTRLANTILKSITVSHVVFWTDSTNVLYWVKNRSRKFKTFVVNRVGEIQETTDPEQWRHVPGHANPADLATRGISISGLAESKLWLEGPQFLLKSEKSWPKRDLGTETSSVDMSEENKVLTTQVTTVNESEVVTPENYSSFRRLIRVTAWIHRFSSNCARKRRGEDRELNCSLVQLEIKQAERYWLKRTQAEGFRDERQKSLENLCITKDDDGLLRLSGRLQHADLPYESKHPVAQETHSYRSNN